MRQLNGHTGGVRAVAYTPDGRLVSAGEDRTVRVWDQATGEPSITLKASGPLYAVAISPDGRTLAYSGRLARRTDDGTPVHLWDLAASREAGEYRLPHNRFSRSIWSLSFSVDGSILAAAGRWPGGGNIMAGAGGHWWGTSGDGPLADSSAYALGFARDRPVLGVTGNKHVDFYLSPEARSASSSYKLPVSRPEAIVFLPGTTDAVVVVGSSLQIVNADQKSKSRKIKTRFRVVTCIAAVPTGRAVVAGGKPGAVEVYDPVGGTLRARYDFELGGVHGVAVAPDGLTFAVAGEQGLAVCDADVW